MHRYADRCLLKLVHVCPVYCRFCFRREMVGPQGDGTLTGAELDAALAYIESRTGNLGGDSNRRRSVPALGAARARNHRAAGGDPACEDHALAHARARGRSAAGDAGSGRGVARRGATTYVVLHTNHARELTEQARAAIARLVDAGVPMLSQTVLLKGVNDDADTLEALMRGFGRSAGEAVLFASSRQGARHVAFPLLDRAKAKSLVRALHAARVWLGAADLRARYSRRPRQSAAGRAELARCGWRLRSARPRRRVAALRRLTGAACDLCGFAVRHEQAAKHQHRRRDKRRAVAERVEDRARARAGQRHVRARTPIAIIPSPRRARRQPLARRSAH